MTNYKNISLFPGLNSMRFIAAFLVVMHHSETIRKKNNLENLEWLGLFRNGANAVTFFFVLSGFLITYLLLKERGKTNTISIRHFYLKRVLRIWPLYFLLVFIGAIMLPYVFPLLNIKYEMPYTIGETWYYFVFFLPGLVTFFYGHHLLEPLWSIGVEEVFYLVWAPLFKIIKTRIVPLLVIIIAVKAVLKLLGIFVIEDKLFNNIVDTFKFEAMAIGGLGAYFIYTRERSLMEIPIFKRSWQRFFFSFIVIYLCLHSNINNPVWNVFFKTPILSDLLIDALFLYCIICVALVDNSIVKLRSKALSYLGEISYGIYMYHMLVIFATILFLKKFLAGMSLATGSVFYYVLVFIITVGVATASKYLFENYFLKLKDRLSKAHFHY